jgi:hypothetical protein
MAIGQTEDRPNPPGSGAAKPVTLIGTDPRMPSGPAVICTAPTGRTHDCKRPLNRHPRKSLQARGRPHMTPTTYNDLMGPSSCAAACAVVMLTVTIQAVGLSFLT